MKITLSKSQWDRIGKKAGWTKISNELSNNVTPVEKMLGKITPNMTASQIDDFMHDHGYFLFREHYHFGKMLSYRNKQGDKIYFLDGEWRLWEDVKKILQETWRPTGQEEQRWYSENIA